MVHNIHVTVGILIGSYAARKKREFKALQKTVRYSNISHTFVCMQKKNKNFFS
jgi:hypothetical protein